MTKPSIADIRSVVAEHFGLREIEMRSHRRATAVARPRQVAMYLARSMTPMSLPAIGRHFGDRDHTTVLHACRVVPQRAEQDAALAAAIAAIEARLLAPEEDPNQLRLPLWAEWRDG